MFELLDQLLKKRNLKYEELTSDEKETYMEWMRALEGKTLTLEDVKDYISTMKAAVAAQLADTPESETEKNILLKARLKNYTLMEAFLSGPERAKRSIERYLGNQVDNG